MAGFKAIMKSGHPPTLFASFLYFDFCFAIWVLNGAMAPFLSEEFHLTPAQTGFMISLPILAGALMRFPLGVISQYIGRKNAALIEMSVIMLAMAFGYFFVDTFNAALAMGVLLGIAGASFGVALSLGSGWFPPESKGLAMGIAGAGNSGTAFATLFAPLVAKHYGFHVAYAGAGFCMLLPFFVMLIFAKEPPDNEHQSVLEHIRCLWSGDGWMFNLVYIITFGGFIGMAVFLADVLLQLLRHDQGTGRRLCHDRDLHGERHTCAGRLPCRQDRGHRHARGGVHGCDRDVPLADDVAIAHRHRAAVHGLLRLPRGWQRRPVPTGAVALAVVDRGRRFDDR